MKDHMISHKSLDVMSNNEPDRASASAPYRLPYDKPQVIAYGKLQSIIRGTSGNNYDCADFSVGHSPIENCF